MTARSPTRRRTFFSALIVLGCAAILWLGYTWFEARYIRPFSDQTVLFAGDILSLPDGLAGPGRIRVVHF